MTAELSRRAFGRAVLAATALAALPPPIFAAASPAAAPYPAAWTAYYAECVAVWDRFLADWAAGRLLPGVIYDFPNSPPGPEPLPCKRITATRLVREDAA